jgi:hypothetical protein
MFEDNDPSTAMAILTAIPIALAILWVAFAGWLR